MDWVDFVADAIFGVTDDFEWPAPELTVEPLVLPLEDDIIEPPYAA